MRNLPLCILCFLLFTSLLIFSTPSYARTWLVRQDGTGDCSTIQGCIGVASSGDTVLVGAGTYNEALVITVPLSLVSELGAEQTTVHGNGSPESEGTLRCITCSHTSGCAYIRGFTITGGGLPPSYPPEPYRYGGGILCTSAQLDVRDCDITYNYGGGVGCRPGSSVSVTQCNLMNNWGCWWCDPYSDPGSAVQGNQATGTVTRCKIYCPDQVGIEWSGGQLTVQGNEIYGDGSSVGIEATLSAVVSLHYNLVRDAHVGIRIDRSAVSIGNNTVVRQLSGGHGISVFQCTGSVSNNIVANSSYGIFCDVAVTLSCNDVWGNALGNYEGTCPHPTDISADPLFCDVPSQNYYLSSSSPCANASGCGLIGAYGVACGPTSVSEATWGEIKALFR